MASEREERTTGRTGAAAALSEEVRKKECTAVCGADLDGGITADDSGDSGSLAAYSDISSLNSDSTSKVSS